VRVAEPAEAFAAAGDSSPRESIPDGTELALCVHEQARACAMGAHRIETAASLPHNGLAHGRASLDRASVRQPAA
jgi:hypothetical protein